MAAPALSSQADRAPARHERGPFLLLAASVLLAMGLWFSTAAVVPQLATHWTLDGSALGWLTASVQLGFVAGALVSAFTGIADRVAVPRLMAGAAGLAALCNAAITVPGLSYEAALGLRAATGFLLAGVYPPGMKLVASWTRRRRGLWVGVLIGALTLGSSLPHLLNATASAFTRDAAAVADGMALPPWQAILLGASALAALGALLALGLRTGPFVAAPGRGAAFHWREVPALIAARDVRLANLGYLGHMWELYAMWTWMPLYLGMAFLQAGLSHGLARWIAFLAIAAGAPGCVLAGWLADRIGRTTTTSIAMLGSGLAALVAAASSGAPAVLAVACVFWGFTVIADSAQFSAAVSELAPAERVGTALTLQTALGFSLTMLSIQLVPYAAAAFGWPVAMGLLAIGPFLGTAAMLRLRTLPEAAAMAGGRR